MQPSQILVALLAAGASCAELKGKSVNSTYIQPQRYVIEVAQGSTLSQLTSELSSLRGTTILQKYDTDVFTGVSVQSVDANLDQLQAIAPAAQVWQSRKIKLPQPKAASVQSAPAAAPSLTTAQQLANQAMTANYSVHSSTGVDKLHAAGLFGKGVKIGSLDTGIDYTVPALGGCFGAGCKIAGGYDLAGDGCWPIPGCSKAPDSDPMDVVGYGTQAAGAIVGLDAKNNFIGVAPEASLYSYKVYTIEFETDEDTLIAAMLMAYSDGMDVINCGLVGISGWQDDAWSVVAERIAEANVVVVMAMGDYGLLGPYFAGSGSAGPQVLAVASLEADTQPAPAFVATFNVKGSSATSEIGYDPEFEGLSPAANGFPIVPLTLSTSVTDDACSPLTSNFTRGYSNGALVMLVRLGGCDAVTKLTNLLNANVSHAILYYQDGDLTNPETSIYNIDGIVIMPQAGEAIVQAWLDGGNVTGNYTAIDPSTSPVGLPDSTSGQPQLETGWGPLYDLNIKPDIGAPGFEVLTTQSQNLGYQIPPLYPSTGTYMASAYIAGVAALYISHVGGRGGSFKVSDLAMRIISSGRPGVFNSLYVGDTLVSTDQFAPVAQVGTGMVNASKVLDYSTQLSLERFSLNDTHHFERYHSVDITNHANVAVTYTFGLVPYAGFETYLPSLGRLAEMPGELTLVKGIVPAVSFPQGTFKVNPGAVKTAQINFEYPSYSNNIPLYSGVIQVNSSLGESFAIPYLGVGANLNVALAKMFVPGYPSIVSGPTFVNISQHSNFSFDLSLGAQDFPQMSFETIWGCDQIRWDIFTSTWEERDWVYPPVIGKNGYVGSATYWQYAQEAAIYDPSDIVIASNISDFPASALFRFNDFVGSEQYWWLGQLANGSEIAVGSYVMRIAAIIPFGNPAHSSGWDTYTVPFSVVPKPEDNGDD